MTVETEEQTAPVRRAHVEVHSGNWNGRDVLIMCDCRIGADHTYAEWVARLGAVRRQAAPITR